MATKDGRVKVAQDLATVLQLQQNSAHKRSGAELEQMGKQAAGRYTAGQSANLTEAVVETVKTACLSPEQVRRVVEFANVTAYLHEFAKQGSPHRVITFAGGPADPSAVLQDLNDGGGGTVYDDGLGDGGVLLKKESAMEKTAAVQTGDLSDYALGPDTVKRASIAVDAEVERMFKPTGPGIPYAEPFRDVLDVQSKVSAACDEARYQINRLEGQHYDDLERLVWTVKQAALQHLPLSHVVAAWSEVASSSETVKLAFELVAPRLVDEGVYPSLKHVQASLASGHDKLAHVVINPAHELVRSFDDFQTTVEKLAAYRAAREQLVQHMGELDAFMKHADQTLMNRLEHVYRGIDEASSAVGRNLSNAVGGGMSGAALHVGAKVAPAYLAYKAVQSARENPTARAIYHGVAQYVPGTRANEERKYLKEMRRQGLA